MKPPEEPQQQEQSGYGGSQRQQGIHRQQMPGFLFREEPSQNKARGDKQCAPDLGDPAHLRAGQRGQAPQKSTGGNEPVQGRAPG